MIVGGVAIAINFYILVIKYIKGRHFDMGVDLAVSSILLYMLSGTLTGIGIAIVGSLMFSFFLLITPNLTKGLRGEEEKSTEWYN